MAGIEAVIILVICAAVALAIVASAKVIRSGESIGRSLAQLAFVWLVPIIGPLITIQLLRKDPERHHLSETDPPGEVDGRINNRPATFGSRGGGRSRQEEAEVDAE